MDLVRVRMEASWSGRLPKRHRNMFDLHLRQSKEGHWDSQSCYTDIENGRAEEVKRMCEITDQGMHGKNNILGVDDHNNSSA